MAGRRTNLALLVALGAAVATGGLAFATGTGRALWAVVAHGCAAACIILLSPWKSVIARKGLARKRPGTTTSVGLAALVIVALGSGFLHSSGVLLGIGPLSTMQIHVGAALLAIPLAVVHARARPARWHRSDASRRQLLRTGALVGAGGLLYAAVEGAVTVAGLHGADRRFTGSYEKGSFTPEGMPVTQWLDDAVPALEASGWRLMASSSELTREWTYEDLAAFDDSLAAALDCTGGWWARQEWGGVWVSRLIDMRGARSLLVTSATGYRRRFPVSDASRLLLATRVAGRPLDAGHGFPARIVAPGRRGFWWVKWVTSIEASAAPWWMQPPFPLT